jgi:glutaryl-CoA dehydrogenase
MAASAESLTAARDFLEVDRQLTDEERDIRDTARAYAQNELLPHVADWFEAGEVPAREVAKGLGGLGLLGMHLEGYGCAGASPTAYGLACLELEAVDSGLRSLMSVQSSLAMYAIRTWGSEEQRERWLPGMAAGDLVGCFGLTEPDHGSDPASMRTRARRDGGDWLLSGQKMWITNGSVSDVAVVWAQTDEGIRGFLVEAGTPGFTTQDIHRKLSLRASVTSELVLDDVRVPDASAFPEVRGLKGPLACLTSARMGIVWGAMGAARASLEAAVEYATTRTQFDRPLAGFQLQQRKLALMAVEVHRGLLLALHITRMQEAGTLKPEHVSFGKLANVRSAIDVCREARAVLGGNGITLEYPVIRHMNNLESVLTYEGTEDIHQLVVGQALTGVSAFR